MSHPSFWTVMRPAMIWPGVLLVLGALFYLMASGERDLTVDLAARWVEATAQVDLRQMIPPATRDARPSCRLHLTFDIHTPRHDR